jgi:hypothetical protein
LFDGDVKEWNMANALVTESASIWGTFIWFHKQITTSLDRMMEVLVKERVAAQRDCFVSFKLLEWIVEALERLLPWKAGVVLTEGPVAEGAEVVPLVIGNVEWVWTLLFLRDLDPMDMPFALEASKDSEENAESSSRSKDSGGDDRSFRAMDGDAMVQ